MASRQALCSDIRLRASRRVRRELIDFPLARRAQCRWASGVLVTQFSPFILSDYYLSSEIDKLQLRFLNRRSKKLDTSSESPSEAVIFVQVDQLDEFVARFFPRLNSPFVLLTGKSNLPSLSRSEAVSAVLKNPHLARWFSQNQIYPDLPIEPFPYGVDMYTSPAVLRLARNRPKLEKDCGLVVPYAKTTPWMPKHAFEIRSKLRARMKEPVPHGAYLAQLGGARFAISPPGDRPDTHRHWECLLVGTTPVSDLPSNFDKLFGGTLVRTSELPTWELSDHPPSSWLSGSEIAYLDYWDRRVRSSFA